MTPRWDAVAGESHHRRLSRPVFAYPNAYPIGGERAEIGHGSGGGLIEKNDYGNSDFDIRHNFSGYIVYDVPGSSWGPRWLTGGWEMTAKMQFRTGEPFTVFASYDTSGTGENTTHGVQVGNPYAGVNRSFSQGQPVQWINPVAFVDPPQGSFGTVGRNTVKGPGYGDGDLGVLKNIPIRERLHAQLRIELFNIFNRVNLAPPSGYIGGGFGQSSDTIGDYNGSPGIGPGEPFNTQLAFEDSLLIDCGIRSSRGRVPQ